MEKQLIRTAISLVVVLLCFCLGFSKDVFCQDKFLDEGRELKQEIQIINLINGLYLTGGQMEFLIEQAEKAKDITEAHVEKYRQYSQNSVQTLERLKSELVDDKGEVSQEVAKATHQVNRRIAELKSDYESKISKVIDNVKNSLTDNQLHGIENFKPCLVPPKGPAHIGQADDPAGGVKHLEHIRNIPSDIYALRKEVIAGRITERILLHKPKGIEIDEEHVRSKILSIFEQARNLSDVDFTLQKEELVKRLKEDVLPEAGKKIGNIDTKIERFLLNSAILSVLRETRRQREERG